MYCSTVCIYGGVLLEHHAIDVTAQNIPIPRLGENYSDGELERYTLLGMGKSFCCTAVFSSETTALDKAQQHFTCCLKQWKFFSCSVSEYTGIFLKLLELPSHCVQETIHRSHELWFHSIRISHYEWFWWAVSCVRFCHVRMQHKHFLKQQLQVISCPICVLVSKKIFSLNYIYVKIYTLHYSQNNLSSVATCEAILNCSQRL